jgi:hypothetical protein
MPRNAIHRVGPQMACLSAVRAKAAEGRRTPGRCARVRARFAVETEDLSRRTPHVSIIHRSIENDFRFAICYAKERRFFKWDSWNSSLRLVNDLHHIPTA